ncbi:bifunctional glutamate N-acetyltransferase/amino-acid acetyltransferase ArgJ [Shimia sp. CNT1-13L.2]|uniref:bifunctional glutamate N-acetyltransferase/amino-acid acetyltransferase ArgJ n=1 Tax=Shimia sp. CNT1-13L.2 TaxID=2959663 RepID=UPI0020CDA8A3|nr:bifunctional glutamate N-acetyltransferase/amino-acid acetyltransferase ArgJ [Shimia sp. CNT1-13L.2]MCP9482567.1 bifunctional glutamate N-acetyltransferase/amino-acid acetyltransferase ArgJ [Shimia sp. CNT1-13L.2]
MGEITHVSPLAPSEFPELPEIGGVEFAAVEAAVKYQNRKDVTLIRLSAGSSMAGVFTKSATRSAAVLDCQEKIGAPSSDGAAIIVNSGNANAFTGKNGMDSVAAVTSAVGECLGLPASRVFSSSTGVIGEALPHDRIISKLSEAREALSASAIRDAAEGIRTTDTFPKGAGATMEIGGKPVKIAGIAKGSGMIAPDMATMLVYIFTDAQVEQSLLQKMLSELTDLTFNNITVDSDTSTSDTLLLGATGASGVEITEDNGAFRDALHKVMLDLAHQVVKDGEGATKFVEVAVTGAASNEDARVHALAIANSPLVKTAVAGEDPNWGRVVMAIGKSGAAADRDLLSIRFGDILVAENGWVSPTYSEEAGATYMKAQELAINVDLGLGDGASTVWTCDLTHGYITINADYRS